MFWNEPADDIRRLAAGKKVLFEFGGGFVHKYGCYDDVKNAVSAEKGQLFDLGNAFREFSDAIRGLELVRQHVESKWYLEPVVPVLWTE